MSKGLTKKIISVAVLWVFFINVFEKNKVWLDKISQFVRMVHVGIYDSWDYVFDLINYLREWYYNEPH